VSSAQRADTLAFRPALNRYNPRMTELPHDLPKALAHRREALFRAILLDVDEETLSDGEAIIDDDATGIFWPDAPGAVGIDPSSVDAIQRFGGGQCAVREFARCTAHPTEPHFCFRV
jgi:hypothetical protein